MPKTKLASGSTLMFWCPGCDEHHGVTVNVSGSWEWNGSHDLPTIKPSIAVSHMSHATGQPQRVVKCHSFVTDGRIEFLDDCTHALAKQTVELPDLDGI